MNKKFLISAVIMMILGIGSAKVVYSKTNGLDSKKDSTYLLILGTYNSKNSLYDDTKSISNLLVLKEKNSYEAVVGISKIKENLEKISKLYKSLGYNLFIKEKNIKNKTFLINLEQFDKLLIEAKTNDEIKTINSVIVSCYEEFILNKENQ